MNALKKINARAKALKKKHPNAKYKTLQKQAGREFKAGKLKTRKKASPKKKKAVRKRRRAVSHKKPVRARVRTVVKEKIRYRTRKAKPKRHSKRRVSGIGAISPIVAVVGLGVVGLIAYEILKPKTPALSPTTNPARAAAQNNIVSYGTAIGLTATAIAKLIDSLNSSDDSTVVNAGTNPAAYVNNSGANPWTGLLGD